MALQYGNSLPITITAGGLTSNSNRSSAAVTTDITKNVTNIMLTVNILTTTGTPTGNKLIVVYGYMSEDGTNYSGASGTVDNVDGTDKTLTAVGSPTNLKFIGVINLSQGAAAVTQRGIFEVTSKFGCVPPKWGIVLYNDCGITIGATVTASYREVYYN
jgi:hypothetical protein